MSFEQLSPLGELTIRWTGQESGEIEISDEFDLPAVQDNQERTPEPNE